ncbi:hypothetical protein QR680_012603 [Steinernema hermaphroditum]|uniref:Uncharacterized protein n=1 Tax=Steinernema hermaphroditum TaxID=289476 RepID=A0AA39I3W1_9BILA|nr:hypothetical protein QR680_012603 [Steinernema hermaphroditum]
MKSGRVSRFAKSKRAEVCAFVPLLCHCLAAVCTLDSPHEIEQIPKGTEKQTATFPAEEDVTSQPEVVACLLSCVVCGSWIFASNNTWPSAIATTVLFFRKEKWSSERVTPMFPITISASNAFSVPFSF